MNADPLGALRGRFCLTRGAGDPAPRGARLPVISHPRQTTPLKPTAPPVRLPALTGASPATIEQLVATLLLLLLIDDSGSMYGRYGDDAGIRYAAARSLLDLVARHGRARAGVVHWGSHVGEVVSPVDVRRDRRQLHQALRIPPTLGGNDLPTALRRAANLLPAALTDQVPLVFVLTDGCEPITTAMHDAVVALPPGAVHVALIDRSHALDSASEAAWRTLALGSFTRLDLDTTTLARQLADVVARALGLHLPSITS